MIWTQSSIRMARHIQKVILALQRTPTMHDHAIKTIENNTMLTLPLQF